MLVQAKGEFLSNLSKKVRVVDLAASSTYTCLPALVRYLRETEPAVMISALDLTNLMALIAKRFAGSPKKLFVRLDTTQSVLKRSFLKKKLEKILIQATYPWAERIISISHGVTKDFVGYTGISPERITTIYNPVITDEIYCKARQPIDHPWFAPTAPPVILGVGRLVHPKNFSLLLRAFAKVRKSQQAHLVILGEGEERPELEAIAERLKIAEDISLPGIQKNPYAYMARARLLVLSSRYEGLPAVLVEALACGCPVVSVDCPNGPREILSNGKYGYLVPVGDEDALAEAIVTALIHPKPVPDYAWLEQFKLDNVVQAYLNLID